MAFFASPAKGWLIKQLNQRAATATGGPADKGRTITNEHLKSEDGKEEEPILGLPPDPDNFEELVSEVKADIETMHRMGFRRAETMPSEKTEKL